MTALAHINGPGWSTFLREDQWILKFKAGKLWQQHRIPKHIRAEHLVRRYVRSFLVAEAAETKVQPPLPPPATGGPPQIRREMSLQELAHLWTSGALAQMFPDHIRNKRSSRSDRARLTKYIEPILGAIPIGAFEGVPGLELAETVMRRLPAAEQLSRDSRRHVAQIIHRLLALAVYPLRLITANPLPRGWLPKGSSSKAKSYLYPREDEQLLGKTTVPLLNRLFYGFLTREGLRATEARELLICDVDMDHGVCNLDTNKTDDPRSWALSPGVLDALRRFLARHRPEAKPDELLFMTQGGRRPPGNNLARALRRDLKTAMVQRTQLFSESAERKRIRGHDLRATFVTINLANGKTETWISDRTGHKSSQMISKYRRLARSHAELCLGDLVPLVSAIPELTSEHARAPGSSKKRVRTNGHSNGHVETEIEREAVIKSRKN